MQISRFNQPPGFGPRYGIFSVAQAECALHDAGPFGLDHGERFSEAQEALDACAGLVRACVAEAQSEGRDTSPGSAHEIAFRVVELTYQGTSEEGRWVPSRFVEVEADEDRTVECIYCGSTRVRDRGEQQPPAEHDDAAWVALAPEHAPTGCEWIETRAHRRDAVRA